MVRKNNAFWLLLIGTLLGSCSAEQRDIVTGRLKPYHLPTTSMEPTIKKDEYALAEPLDKDAGIRRGELVVFTYPLDPKTVLAKRVVALPGDKIEVRHKQLFVNGEGATEPYAIHSDPAEYSEPGVPGPYRSRDNFGPVTVPQHQYFVLGDNRDGSNDSRYWGSVPRLNIRAKIVRAGPLAGPFRHIQ
jgi:signal peptidase I